MNTTQPTTKP